MEHFTMLDRICTNVYENLLTSIFCLITRMWHALSRRFYEPDMFSSETPASLKLLGGQNSCLTRQRLIRRVFDYRFAMAKGTARIWLDPSSVICFCLELSINSVRLSSSTSRTGILHIYRYTNQLAIKLTSFLKNLSILVSVRRITFVERTISTWLLRNQTIYLDGVDQFDFHLTRILL